MMSKLESFLELSDGLQFTGPHADAVADLYKRIEALEGERDGLRRLVDQIATTSYGRAVIKMAAEDYAALNTGGTND